jgi:hypothetical protein
VHDLDFSQTPRLDIDTTHVVQEVEETKEPAKPVPVSSSVEVDINVIKAAWPFLRPTDVIPADARLKFSVGLCRDLLEELQ